MRPEDIFKEVTDLMRFGGNITNTSELDGVTTITTDNIGTLQAGMLIEVGNDVSPVSNIVRTGFAEWTFDITATDVTALTWQLALYYEFGRALEVGNTLEDKKGDPANKNKRFPLVWLLTDIDKNYDTADSAEYEANIIIGLVYVSEANLKAEQRIDTYFEPILDPLVEKFKDVITTSPGRQYFIFSEGERLKIRQTDKFKYGSINGNTHIFNTICDAIELNLNLKFAYEESNCTQ